MEEPNINFTVEHNNLYFLQNIFIGDYGKYNSPLLPIYIISGPELSVDEYKEEKAHSNFLVVELCKDSDQGYREIAFILMRYQSDDEIYVAFQGLWEGEDRWDQVEKLVKSILCFVYDRGYKIISANPFNIIPREMYSPKKVSEELEKSTESVSELTGIPGKNKGLSLTKESSESIGSPIYIPTRPKSLARYKEAYAIIKRLDKEYFSSWEDDSQKQPKPKILDYRDAIVFEMKPTWKPSTKTIERIIKVGNAKKWK